MVLLQNFIYFVFISALISYAVLDGFDLGVGSLHLFARGDRERRLMLNAIGPVWDGNTTWIVVSGGVLFAGFPKIFANMTSGLYTPLMMLLFGFMLRGASVEFRSKKPGKIWRTVWDSSFCFASLLLALTASLVIGNLIQGFPLDSYGQYVGGLAPLINPYALSVALFGLSLFCMHGSLYLGMKTEGEFHERLRRWSKRLVTLFLLLWGGVTIATHALFPHMGVPFFRTPILIVFPLFFLLAVVGLIFSFKKRRASSAFFCSCLTIFLLLSLFVIGTYPKIIISSIPGVPSLTLYNSSASFIALMAMAIVAILGIPLAYFYVSYIYKVFRGKVHLDNMSY